ncbi:glycosyl transferase [Paramagnetospirillum kuznetsovii]|uniref:Glycosyl transferase n=1 Tax=Paramagnetospirillum kuznetsovii TaxID=2053833 RepID=A0A364P2R0_9PROT|nr:glycosyltransferase family 2 protein [Paramagnetospirillum kuznetsovii]RAU23576.1 glycosyl transferase [Paramagnetospirillum kuznetsovii]
MKKLSVVVPVYFNEGSLVLLHERLDGVGAQLATLGVDLEMIFVDDGSGDRSAEVLLDLHAKDKRVKVARHTRNFGSFPAMKSGIGLATGDCVATLSADLQDPPELLLDMVKRWLDGEKFMIAVRATRDDPADSKLFSMMYYRLLKWLVIADYPTGGFDFMLVDRAMVGHIVNGPKCVNINLYAYWLGFAPSIITYDRVARRHGKSRWTFTKKLNLFVDTFTGFSVRPIRFMTMLGVGAAVLGFLYGLYVVGFALINGSPAAGFPTLAALVSLFSGLIMVMLGLIGEYLWRIFDAVNRKPEAVIGEVHE